MVWALVGLVVGLGIGIVTRPSLPLLGQLPIGIVLTRGATLVGLDMMLRAAAEESFNYIVIVAIIGVVVGAGLGLYAARKDVPRGLGGDDQAAQTTTKCPECAEAIQIEALVCKHCHYRFNPDEVARRVEAKRTSSGIEGQSSADPDLIGRFASRSSGRALHEAGPLWRRRVFWAAALTGAMAAGLAGMVVGWTFSATYERRLAAATREVDLLKADLAVVELLKNPSTRVLALAGLAPSPNARGRMIWHTETGGLLVTAGLPAPPVDKTYQLWALTGSRTPISAGVFVVNASGTGDLSVRPLQGVKEVHAFAVTLEPTGGLSAPSGETYMLGRF